MSQSKLESLPNEILIEIFEKYMNGVDVLTVFYGQLNQRFTTLVETCYQLRLNFIRCSKTRSLSCLDHLPMYADRIEEILISEEDTPGQTYTFLSSFPSLEIFRRLRSFYFHSDSGNTDSNLVDKALRSLFNTSIERLTIRIKGSRGAFVWGPTIDNLFYIQTLKRFCVISDHLVYIDWIRLARSSPSQIECLVLSGVDFGYNQFQSLAQWAPDLKHLSLRICDSNNDAWFGSGQNSQMRVVPFSKLQTLRWSFTEYSRTIDILTPYLSAMPVLKRLEIVADKLSMTSEEWEAISTKLSSSLTTMIALQSLFVPSRNNTFDVLDFYRDIIILPGKTIKTPESWITRFYLRSFLQYYNANCQSLAFRISALQRGIAPKCFIKGEYYHKLDSIKNLVLFMNMDIDVYECYYFSNIKLLIVENLNQRILKWMKTCVNCTSIVELALLKSLLYNKQLDSLMELLPNVCSLHITFDLLKKHADDFIGITNSVSCLNLTSAEHSFEEKDIAIISNLFPYLEHLKIYTSNFKNIRLLKTYFPRLISLTVQQAIRSYNPPLLYYFRNLRKYEVRIERLTPFRDEMILLTIWIDETIYEELQLIENNINENKEKQEKQKKKNIFSFLKFKKK